MYWACIACLLTDEMTCNGNNVDVDIFVALDLIIGCKWIRAVVADESREY
jgi:hypothetical protein